MVAARVIRRLAYLVSTCDDSLYELDNRSVAGLLMITRHRRRAALRAIIPKRAADPGAACYFAA